MVFGVRAFCAVCVTLQLCAAWGMDLTPRIPADESPTARFPRLEFFDGERRVEYVRPDGWAYSGDRNRFTLRAAKPFATRADIEQVPLDSPARFDEKTLEELREQARLCVPSDCSDTRIVLEEKNPMLINGKETYRIVVSFKIMNREYKLSVLFLNLQGMQLRFKLLAYGDSFEEAYEPFRRSLYTFQWF